MPINIPTRNTYHKLKFSVSCLSLPEKLRYFEYLTAKKKQTARAPTIRQRRRRVAKVNARLGGKRSSAQKV